MRPGGGIQNNEHLAVIEPVGRNVGSKFLEFSLAVEELQIRRNGKDIAHEHVLAQTFQDLGQGYFAAQGIAVRPNVRGQRKSLMAANNFNEPGPIEHVSIFSFKLSVVSSY